MVGNSTLRYNARIQLGGHVFDGRWVKMTFILTVASLLSGIPGNMVGYITGYWEEGVVFISIGKDICILLSALVLAIVLAGPFKCGMARMTVDCVENGEWGFGSVFHGFRRKFLSSILLDFLTQIFLALWTLLLLIPGLVKSYSYSMAFYIRQDPAYSHLSASDCITESRKMMDGYKWRLFCLDLSFIGWYIVGALCLGVGVLFVMAYHEVARANFYDALKADRAQGFSY